MVAVPGPNGSLLNEGKEEKKRKKFQHYQCLITHVNLYGTTLKCFRLGSLFLSLFFFLVI